MVEEVVRHMTCRGKESKGKVQLEVSKAKHRIGIIH